jgi:hypothetical protein
VNASDMIPNHLGVLLAICQLGEMAGKTDRGVLSIPENIKAESTCIQQKAAVRQVSDRENKTKVLH